MNDPTESAAPPLLVVADFVCTEEGEGELARHLDRTLAEARSIDGCLHAAVWTRPGRRLHFSTLWTDREALGQWVENEFHRTVLMPAFRKWCSEGWFGEYVLSVDHPRAKRCVTCGRWTQGRPGWSEIEPRACRQCDAPLA